MIPTVDCGCDGTEMLIAALFGGFIVASYLAFYYGPEEKDDDNEF